MVPPNIFIFGMPRTGTTLLQHILSQHFALPNLQEPLITNQFHTAQQLHVWISEHGPGVIKILAGQPHWQEIDAMLTAGTRLFVMIRQNLTDSCISLHVAKRTGQYHYITKPDLSYLGSIHIPLDHVDYWLAHIYRPFYHTVTRWEQQGRSTPIIYEKLISDDVIDVGGNQIMQSRFPPTRLVNAEISYASLCSNYQEVQQRILAFCP